MLRLLVRAGVVLGTFMTAAGVLAPLFPQADFTNHFRPYTLAGAGALLGLALAMRLPEAVRWSAVLAAINAALLLLPLLWSAETAQRAAAGQAQANPGHRDLAIVTFNLAGAVPVENIAHFLAREDPDLVVLQEVTGQQFAALQSLLAARYPHSDACLVYRACRQAIFSKRPWVSTAHEYRGDEIPEILSAAFDDPEFGTFRIHNVHLALPYRPRQAPQVDRLIALRAAHAEPAIFAGDFNMTPWSYRLQRLLASAGLRRHATFLRSWPTNGAFLVPAPAFLIDHVLTTPNIRTISIATGPNLGSDHLPVIARLRLSLAR